MTTELRVGVIGAGAMGAAHLAAYAELEGVICSGPRRAKQFTYALLATRAPGARRLSRDESLAERNDFFFVELVPIQRLQHVRIGRAHAFRKVRVADA